MSLDVEQYKLFTNSEFQSVTQEDLNEKLFEANINNNTASFILYVSQLISNCIREHTSLNLYKTSEDDDYGDYTASLGLSKVRSKEIVDAYIVGDEYHSNWLSLTEGGEPIIPNSNKRYLIKSDGVHQGKTFAWNGYTYILSSNIDIIYEVKLTRDQITALKLACIYQADYILDNGSTERMSAISLVNRSNKYDKADLKEFEICSMSYSLLSQAGLLYQGIGGGVYARTK